MSKVTFDGTNKLIKVDSAVVTLDIQIDIYSEWKLWLLQSDNAKFLPAMRTIGGDPTIQEKTVAPYFFLTNGWKIKPYSWTHTLNIIGNLFVDEPEVYGSNIVVPCDGEYTVLVNLSTTSDASRITVGSGVLQSDIEAIAELVEETTGIPLKADVTLVRKIEYNKMVIIDDKLYIYDDNGTDVIATYSLSGELKKNYSRRDLI